MLLSSKTLLAVLAISAAPITHASECELAYVLHIADTDTPVGLLENQLQTDGSYCIPNYKVRIQARPTATCSTTESAFMALDGPIKTSRTKNLSPYTIFSDSRSNIFGRDLLPGAYTIDSKIFSRDHLRGRLVVERELKFKAKFCDPPEPVVKRGYIEVVNKAPLFETCQTPVWVGIHDGSFDTYDRDKKLPEFMEALVEDGNNAPITAEFACTHSAVWDGTIGDGPICPGETAYIPFEIEILPNTVHYFSYASMILPSNDAFVSNGNPKAFPVFSAGGEFLPVLVESTGNMALDGGTELNDEIPKNTAFFGQMTPNTGSDENGVVTLHPGFNPEASGGILDTPQFTNADFTVEGYQFMEISVHLGDKPDPCELEFILYDADKDVALRPLKDVECAMHNEFSIQARPTAECTTTLSADMKLTGPIHQDHTENFGPYMIFGDNRAGNVYGRGYKTGSYRISASIYSKRHLWGDIVVEREFDFTVKNCHRSLRAHA